MISIVYACMDREKNLLESLDSWIDKTDKINEIIIIDWSSKMPLINNAKIQTHLNTKKIRLIRVENQNYFSMSRSYNLGFNLSSNKIILKLDADYKNLNCSWINHLAINDNNELDKYFVVGHYKFSESLSGFFLVNKKDFVHYNENFQGWGYDDTDIYNRIQEKDILKVIFFNIKSYVQHLDHTDEDRTSNFLIKDKRESEKQNKLLSNSEFSITKYKKIFDINNYEIYEIDNE